MVSVKVSQIKFGSDASQLLESIVFIDCINRFNFFAPVLKPGLSTRQNQKYELVPKNLDDRLDSYNFIEPKKHVRKRSTTFYSLYYKISDSFKISKFLI